jgi:phosphoglycolate phosphatase-like HAD superfamily hydrolase
MIRIEVKSTDIFPFSGISQKTGKPFSIRNQEVYAFTVDDNGNPRPYPEMIKLSLDDNQLPYPVGFYTIKAQSLFVDKFQRLSIGRLFLVAVQNNASRAL